MKTVSEQCLDSIIFQLAFRPPQNLVFIHVFKNTKYRLVKCLRGKWHRRGRWDTWPSPTGKNVSVIGFLYLELQFRSTARLCLENFLLHEEGDLCSVVDDMQVLPRNTGKRYCVSSLSVIAPQVTQTAGCGKSFMWGSTHITKHV